MTAIQTIRIKCDIPGCEGGLDINASDYDPEKHELFTEAEAPTRESIAAMPKAELVEWLQAHGVDAPKGTVPELRAALTAIMFVDG